MVDLALGKRAWKELSSLPQILQRGGLATYKATEHDGGRATSAAGEAVKGQWNQLCQGQRAAGDSVSSE